MEPLITVRIAAVSLGAFLINALVTPVLLHLAHRFGWYDHIDERKIHTNQTPRIGGIGIFSAFVIGSAVGVAWLTGNGLAGAWTPTRLVLLAAAMATMHALGLYDDFVNLPAIGKLMVQIASGLLVALSGATIGLLDLPWFGVIVVPAWIALPATVFWVVSISNAVNLIDGADGLAGGVSLIAALFMGLIAIAHGAWLAAFLAFALVGALAGFLLFNLPPARIFMGDSGSLLLGFSLAVLPLVGLQETFRAPSLVPLLPVLTLVFIPIVDTVLAILRRLGRGLPVHAPDREHLHHRLIDLGFAGRRLLGVIYAGGIALGFAAMSWYAVPRPVSTILMGTTWTVAVVAILLIGRFNRS